MLELYGRATTVPAPVGNSTIKPAAAGRNLDERPVLATVGDNGPQVSPGGGGPHASPEAVLSVPHWACIYGLPTSGASLFNFPCLPLMFYGGIAFATGCHSRGHLAMPPLVGQCLRSHPQAAEGLTQAAVQRGRAQENVGLSESSLVCPAAPPLL